MNNVSNAIKKLLKTLLFLSLFLSFIALGQSERQPSEGIYYEIFVRSFQDSDGDGIGDFQGIIQRLDYLEDLGISGIWLMPIHPSPNYHGYDVSDYYALNPDYGTMADFQKFLDEAQARGISVIIDLVVNHSSVEHPWFKAANAGDPQYRDYYLWSETDLGWRGVSGAPAWHQGRDGYYLGLFWSGMPDLNYRNPAVVEKMNDIAKFWLELGVDGFRVDAIQHIVESEDGLIRNTPDNLAWVRNFEAFIKTVNPQAFIVGETWTDSDTIVKYHQEANLDMSFNYPLFDALISSIQKRNPSNLKFVLEQDEQLYPSNALRGIFISNHDQIRPATSLSFLKPDPQRSKLAAALMFTLPGIPFMYYGEEIGLPNGPGDRDEEKRTPMRWNEDEYAGFSSVEPWYSFSTEDPGISVAAQQNRPDSLLNWYKQLIALRNTNPALERGKLTVLESGERSVLAFSRELNEQRLLILANFASSAKEIDLSTLTETFLPRDLLSGNMQPDKLSLPPLGLMVLDVSSELDTAAASKYVQFARVWAAPDILLGQ